MTLALLIRNVLYESSHTLLEYMSTCPPGAPGNAGSSRRRPGSLPLVWLLAIAASFTIA